MAVDGVQYLVNGHRRGKREDNNPRGSAPDSSRVGKMYALTPEGTVKPVLPDQILRCNRE